MEKKRKPGRPPKGATVEKRVERALRENKLVEELDAKRGPGRPPLAYEDRPEHIRFVIDCAAMGYSPSRIQALMKEKYGDLDDRVIGIRTIEGYRKKYFSQIQQREKEFRIEMPILQPSMRVRYLQQVVDEALNGVERLSKTGQVYTVKDHAAAISAIKEINAMQKDLDSQRQSTAVEMSQQREIEEQKEVIREYVSEQMTMHPGKKAIEILREMSDSLTKEFPEAVEQLVSEYKM